MSLLKPTPPVPKPIDPIQVKIVDEGYKGVTVDSAVTPLANIIQYAEGHTWEVEYFSQVLGEDDEPQPHQTDRSAPYQQYVLIKGFELKVTSPLAVSQDQTSRSMILEGTALVPTGVIPNKGDCFFADIGQGREGHFTVTTVEKKTHFKQTVYSIGYEVTNYSDHDVSAIRTDLDAKLVKVVHFVKDHNFLGVNPLMLTEDFNFRIEFQRRYRELTHYYFSDFFSREYRTLLVPDQLVPTYDPYLTDAILNWVEVEDHPYITQIARPRLNNGTGRLPDTVWTAITQMDYTLLRNAIHRTGLLHRSYFRGQPDLAGLFYLGVGSVVYQNETGTNVDDKYVQTCTPQITTNVQVGSMRFDDLNRIKPISELPGLFYAGTYVEGDDAVPTLPMVAPVSTSANYVFSENFYSGTGILASNLERLIYQALKHDTLEKPLLASLTESAMRWDNLERFYYIPVLLALLRVAIRDN